MFFEVIKRTNTPLKRVFKRLFAFYAAFLIRELKNWRFRFLMSRTDHRSVRQTWTTDSVTIFLYFNFKKGN